MKKIMFALVCAFGCLVSFGETSNVITNVYDFKASLKVPYLQNGIRNYSTQTLKGYLFTEIVDGQSADMWLELQNTKTKVVHFSQFNDGFYCLIGKSNKYSERTVPTVYYEASDIDISGGHELIKKVQFAGTGSLKTVKTVTAGCSYCGEPTKTTSYCNILVKMSGYATGVMDCCCPEDEDWTHTLRTTLCGVYYDELGDIDRSHDAAFWGSWSATFNKKYSDTVVK